MFIRNQKDSFLKQNHNNFRDLERTLSKRLFGANQPFPLLDKLKTEILSLIENFKKGGQKVQAAFEISRLDKEKIINRTNEKFKAEGTPKLKQLKQNLAKTLSNYKFNLSFPIKGKIGSISIPKLNFSDFNLTQSMEHLNNEDFVKPKVKRFFTMQNNRNPEISGDDNISADEETLKQELKLLSSKNNINVYRNTLYDDISEKYSRKKSKESKLNHTFNSVKKNKDRFNYDMKVKNPRIFSSSLERFEKESMNSGLKSGYNVYTESVNNTFISRRRTQTLFDYSQENNEVLENLLCGRYGKVIKMLQQDSLNVLDLSFAGKIIRLKRHTNHYNSGTDKENKELGVYKAQR